MANFVLMGKRRIIPDPILMLITILVVTGFQVYWLKNNYDRERKSLEIKANVAFQDAVRHLQALKLKLKDPSADTSRNAKMRVIVDHDVAESDMETPLPPKKEIVTIVNLLSDKIRDSGKSNARLIVSSHKDSDFLRSDSLSGKFNKKALVTLDGNNKFVRFLYSVDSLQDSLKIPEITAACQSKLKEQLLSVPFTVVRIDSATDEEDKPDFSNITVGFAHPITYHLELGNSFPYLIKKISLPILFSVFLVGVTVLSFVVLYRNLLRQRRLAEIKNEFIGNITHELKTPIATVGVAIEALKSFNAMHDPQRTKEYLDISANELQRLSLLVDKVLKLSMFEKKEIDLKFENVDLREVTDEVVASMRLQIEKAHATVAVTSSGDTNLEADRLHLLSVVFNLLDNALKYGGGEPVVAIELTGTDDFVQLTVNDNGIGIAPEYQKKIFEKFFRVPSGNTHNAKGYGLGLSYVSHVVEKHRGHISVDSSPGTGTKITIQLPKKNA